MRSNCSLYVDAGYLLGSAATRLTGTSLRNGIHVAYPALIDALVRQAEEASGLPALRVHWYDSAKDGVPDAQQERIGELPRVKLRLGRFGVDGQQKGVDLRIGLDLVAHARNGVADVFFLVSGDDDLTEAVEEAQALGVQVKVLAVPNADNRPHGVSRHLVRAADELALIAPETVDENTIRVAAPSLRPAEAAEGAGPAASAPSPSDIARRIRPGAAPVLAYSSSSGSPPQLSPGYGSPEEYDSEIDTVTTNVIESFRQSASPDEVAELLAGRPSILPEVDRALLLDLSEALGTYALSVPLRFRLRHRFWEVYDRLS
ncbi:MAG: NYN domain-containing protein [Microbacteriaceae bacterium]